MPTPNLNSENPEWDDLLDGVGQAAETDPDFADFQKSVAKDLEQLQVEKEEAGADQGKIAKLKEVLGEPNNTAELAKRREIAQQEKNQRLAGEIDQYASEQDSEKLSDAMRAWIVEGNELVNLPEETKEKFVTYIRDSEGDIVIPGVQSISTKDLNFIASNIGSVEGKALKKIVLPGVVRSEIDDDLEDRLSNLEKTGKFAWG